MKHHKGSHGHHDGKHKPHMDHLHTKGKHHHGDHHNVFGVAHDGVAQAHGIKK